ncbi:MAG: class I SAM-dependent methyltransferase [Anaerolineales bacterium]|nr:class I SAM-dependent methyltransferase [Anaerolineales bacterium]
MPALYRYNDCVNSEIAKQLIELNRKFYDQFGDSFSATRGRLQNGVMKVLEAIQDDESVLDLGCGNGLFLHTLSKRGHNAPLLGVDFSLPLLRDAESSGGVEFREVDLSKLSAFSDQLLITDNWSLITCFATLHHIPSNEIRLDILKTVKTLLKPNGRFVLSNWQFLNSEKLKSRIQSWEKVGLTNQDVDENDYLLDWRNGGEGLRYAHHFSSEELHTLANQVEMRVEAEFLSDGENGRLGLYQVWRHA